MRRWILLLEMLKVALLLFLGLVAVFVLRLQASAEVDEEQDQGNHAQNSDDHIEAEILVPDSALAVGVRQGEVFDPVFEFCEGAGCLATTEGDGTLDSVVEDLFVGGVRKLSGRGRPPATARLGSLWQK